MTEKQYSEFTIGEIEKILQNYDDSELQKYTFCELKDIVETYEKRRLRQLAYSRKYFQTEKGRSAHYRSNRRSLSRRKIKKFRNKIEETQDEAKIEEYKRRILYHENVIKANYA